MNHRQRRTFGPGLLLAMICIAGCAATPGRVSQTQPVRPIDAVGGAGIEGFDAVAYFTDGRPIPGNDAYTQVWQGATWKFASAEHRDLFATNPQRYAPQYGGYCAYAVSHGATAHGDPKQWAVVGERLFLNNNPFAKSLWDRDRPENIRAGDQNWPLIPKSDGVSGALRE